MCVYIGKHTYHACNALWRSALHGQPCNLCACVYIGTYIPYTCCSEKIRLHGQQYIMYVRIHRYIPYMSPGRRKCVLGCHKLRDTWTLYAHKLHDMHTYTPRGTVIHTNPPGIYVTKENFYVRSCMNRKFFFYLYKL